MAIAYNESMYHPYAQGGDNIGRGLWQIGGPGGPVQARGLTGPQCQGGNPGKEADVSKCQAFDPIKSGKVAGNLTNNGKDWLPKGSQWWSCQNGTTKASSAPGFNSQQALTACKTAANSFGVNVSDWSSTSKCSDGSAPDGSVYKCPDPSQFAKYCGSDGTAWGNHKGKPYTKCENGWCVP